MSPKMSIPEGFWALILRYWSSPSTALYMAGKSMTGTVRVPSMSKTTPLRRVLTVELDIRLAEMDRSNGKWCNDNDNGIADLVFVFFAPYTIYTLTLPLIIYPLNAPHFRTKILSRLNGIYVTYAQNLHGLLSTTIHYILLFITFLFKH